MNDIVERLRGMEDLAIHFEAAAEIERLRDEVDLKGHRLDDALDEIGRLRAELDWFSTRPGRRNAFESLVEKEEGCDSP